VDVVPVPAAVHPLVESVFPEKYTIPSAVLTIGSPFNNVKGSGLLTTLLFFKTCIELLVAITLINKYKL
jgi:hypothetical protein